MVSDLEAVRWFDESSRNSCLGDGLWEARDIVVSVLTYVWRHSRRMQVAFTFRSLLPFVAWQ